MDMGRYLLFHYFSAGSKSYDGGEMCLTNERIYNQAFSVNQLQFRKPFSINITPYMLLYAKVSKFI